MLVSHLYVFFHRQTHYGPFLKRTQLEICNVCGRWKCFFYIFVGAPAGPDPRRAPGGPSPHAGLHQGLYIYIYICIIYRHICICIYT